MKTYLMARNGLSDLIIAQKNERMTSNLKRWIENGAPDKGDLEGTVIVFRDSTLCRRREGYI